MTTNDLEPGTELCTTAPSTLPTTTRTDRGPGMHWSFRADRRVVWVGYHLPELAAVTLPGVLAVTWHWSFLALAGTVAALWGTHEYRRNRRRDNSSGGQRAVLTPDQADGTHTGTDTGNKEAHRGLA